MLWPVLWECMVRGRFCFVWDVKSDLKKLYQCAGELKVVIKEERRHTGV